MNSNLLNNNFRKLLSIFNKNNPIFIYPFNQEIFKNLCFNSLKYQDRYYFSSICIDCKNIFTKRIRKDKFSISKNFFCKCGECLKKETNIQKYGVENVSQSEKILSKEKRKQIIKNIKKAYSMNKDVILDKMKQTCKNKYGTDWVFQSDLVKNKIKKTNIIKYGVEYSVQSDIVKQHLIKTNQKKYGVNSTMQLKSVRDKRDKNLLEKYGSLHPMRHWYYWNNISFDSSWELAFYIYYIDNDIPIIREPEKFKFFYENIERTYIPDFFVNNKYYEIKASYFFENGKMINPYNRSKDAISNARFECAKSHNVIFISDNEIKFYIDYINNKYGKNYLSQFRKR